VATLNRAVSIYGARVGVVGEDYCRTYKYPSLEDRWFIDQGVILNLAIFSDRYTRTDVGAATNNAACSKRNPVTYLSQVPNTHIRP
jgi:hypothetical protein